MEEARSKELFNMIFSCVTGGHALNTIEKVCDDNNGLECRYLAWKSLKDWYLDPTQVDSMIFYWERKLLGDVVLDVDTSVTEYINNFEMYVRKLLKLGENWTDDKKVREFKADPDYDTEVRVHKGNFAKLIETVREREQDLECSATHQRSQKNKRTRRASKFKNDSDKEEGGKSKSGGKRRTGDSPHGKPIPHIPFIPKFFFMSLDANTRKNLMTSWRKMTNQGETMEKKDLVSLEDDKGAHMHSKNKTEKKKGHKAPLVTKTRRVGIQDDTVEIKLASSDDSEYSTILTCPNFESQEPIVTIGDDSNFESKSNHSIKSGAEGTSTRI